MTDRLKGRRVAILATDGFEESELFTPLEVLKGAGASVDVVSLRPGTIQGFDHLKPGKTHAVDATLENADSQAYDALVLPGGANNPDRLRIEETALDFVRGFDGAGKPMGVICHAPWILINAGIAEGKTLTSYKTIRQDLANAGAKVIDQDVVVDGHLITSRGPDDLPAFCERLVEMIAGEDPPASVPE
ncbi:MAG TPA: type 1 glutamine amidotransferase domain-containing protein [Caulobacteraceae bacterium]|jgi:protease I|nr:type 1 glutamine amidotransferase domain-containing protein [Caulobacteraceae bacterium]